MTRVNTTLLVTCHKKDSDTTIWDHWRATYPNVDNAVIGGDRAYFNPFQSAKDWPLPWTFIRTLSDQDDLAPGFADLESSVDTMFLLDDHDTGVLNNEFHTTAPNNKLDLSYAGLQACYPLPPAPAGMPSTGTFYCSVDRQGLCHMYYCARSNWRSDPDAADVTWNPGDPAPTKSPLGAAQDAWFAEQIQRTDVIGFVHHFSLGFTGTAADFVPHGTKKDAIAWYPEWRKWWSSLAGARPGIITDGDWHITGVSAAEPHSGLPLIHAVGANRESGNTTWPTEWGTTWPPVVIDPDDPDDPGVGVTLNIYGVIITEWAGSTLTITARVHDSLNDVIRGEVVRSWTVAPEPLADFARVSYDVDELLGTDPAGRWWLDPDTDDPSGPAKDIGLVEAGSRGSRMGGVHVGTGFRGLSWTVTDKDANGVPGGMAQKYTNLGLLKSVLMRPEVDLKYRPDGTEMPTQHARSAVRGSLSPQSFGGAAGRLSHLKVGFDLLDGPMRAMVPLTWVKILGVDGNVANEQVGILDGSTAPVLDALVQIRGPANLVIVTDNATGAGFRFKLPGADELIEDGQFLLVDAGRAQAWIGETDSFDPADFDEAAHAYLSPFGPGEAILPLTPQGDPDHLRVFIRAQTNASSATTRIGIQAAGAWW